MSEDKIGVKIDHLSITYDPSKDKARSLLRDLYFSMTDPWPIEWSEQMQAINRRSKLLEEVQKYLRIIDEKIYIEHYRGV